jgi:hypothetical protein
MALANYLQWYPANEASRTAESAALSIAGCFDVLVTATGSAGRRKTVLPPAPAALLLVPKDSSQAGERSTEECVALLPASLCDDCMRQRRPWIGRARWASLPPLR